MPKILEKVKDFFGSKFVYKPKKKPAQPAGREESKPKQKNPNQKG